MEVNSSTILSDAQVHQIVTKAVGDDKTWKLLKIEDKRASDQVIGIIGDHRRMTIYVDVDGQTENISLFIKLMPANEAKAAFVKKCQFFSREAITLSLVEKITTPDPHPWCTIAYLRNENITVMPDLALQGYTNRNTKDLDDLPHALFTAVALARFHAAFANYETARSEAVTFTDEYGDQLQETLFIDSYTLRSGILLHNKFLKTFSKKYSNIDVDLLPLYLEACSSVTNYDNTLNTLIHRDLWANNVMFKYENGVPINALLVDFQIARYAPPAFDPMLFLYMTTSKTFRMQHAETFLKKYFATFMEKVDEDTKKRLDDLKYDWTSFREWCENARKFALVGAMHICPLALFNPVTMQKIFESKNGQQLLLENRSIPLTEYAKENSDYMQRLLDMYEEFVDICVPNNEVDKYT